MTLPRPQIDAELGTRLAEMPLMTELNPELLAQMRQYKIPVESFLEGRAIERRELTITATDGAELPLSVFRPANASAGAPCIYWVHGGGMVMGDRFANIDIPLEWLERL